MKVLQTFFLSVFLCASLLGANWFFVSGGAPAWNPTNLTNKLWWYRSDSKVTSGSDVTNWTQLSTDVGAVGVDLTAFAGLFPQVITAAINGQDALQFVTNGQATNTSPTNAVVVSQSSAFSISYVHAGPTLSLGTFYALFTVAGATAADSITLFYTNLTGLPVFYFQAGNGTVEVISIPDFNITNYHYVTINYNGGGSYATAGNWTIYLNSVSQTVATATSSGGAGTTNVIGDTSGGGGPNGGNHVEEFMISSQLTGADLTGANSYFQSRYGL